MKMTEGETCERPGEDEKDDESLSEIERTQCTCIVVVTVVLEFTIFAAICVLEYFLRFTSIFPLRKVNFSCTDPDISLTSDEDKPFTGNLPAGAIYALSFGVPVIIVILVEVVKWSYIRQKKGRISNQVFKHILYQTGIFLFGMVSLMIYIDVTKLMTGRLSPNFLQICGPNTTLCASKSNLGGNELCTQTDEMKLRQARSSFPAIYTGMSSFSVAFINIYIACTLGKHCTRLFLPFVCLLIQMLSVLCGLWEYGNNHSHWTDVVVGFLMGTCLALYLCIFTLKRFEEPVRQDKLIRFFERLIKEQDEENANLRIYRNNNLQRQRDMVYNSPRARWHRAVTSLQEVRANDPETYNTFQRDLTKSIDHYRDRRNTLIDTTEIT